MARPSKRALERAKQLAPDPGAAPVITVRTYRFEYPDPPPARLAQTPLPRPPSRGPVLDPDSGTSLDVYVLKLDPRYILSQRGPSRLGNLLTECAAALGVPAQTLSYEQFQRWRCERAAAREREAALDSKSR